MRRHRAFHDRLLLRPTGRGRAQLAETLGLGEWLRGGSFARRYDVRFARELRAGSSFQVEGAVLGVDGGLRLGHRFVDSANGETVTWIDEHWNLPPASLPREERDAIGGRFATWEGPAAERGPSRKARPGLSRPRAAGSSPAISMRRPASELPRSCIASPMPASRPAPRSAWMPNTWKRTGAASRPSSWRCGCRGRSRARRALSGRDRRRASRQFVAAPHPSS